MQVGRDVRWSGGGQGPARGSVAPWRRAWDNGADPWRTAKGAIVSRCRSTGATHRYKYLYLFVLVEVEHLLLVRQQWFCLDLLWLPGNLLW